MEVSMTAAEVAAFLSKNPKYRAIVERALEVEEGNENPHWLGWKWHDVRAYPAQIVRLVIEGIAKVNFDSNSSTNYLLVDRDNIKRGLAKIT
jgi:hypothetical protein